MLKILKPKARGTLRGGLSVCVSECVNADSWVAKKRNVHIVALSFPVLWGDFLEVKGIDGLDP